MPKSESESDSSIGPLDESELSEMFGINGLDSIMSSYFEYEHPDGNTLNLAEILLLIRQSISENTNAIKELTEATRTRTEPEVKEE
jgi:hypothetical protein